MENGVDMWGLDWTKWKELDEPMLYVGEKSIVYIPYVPLFVKGRGKEITKRQ